jgi:hypothetical protein
MRFSSYFRFARTLEWTRSAMLQKGGSNFVKKAKSVGHFFRNSVVLKDRFLQMWRWVSEFETARSCS